MVRLALENVGARHGRRETLSGITTPTLEGGQIVALLGANASGKSTLLRRIMGLLDGPGDVRLDGVTADRPIAYMPQETRVDAALSVYESILLARMQRRGLTVQPADLEAVDRALETLNIQALATHDIATLSGGQRQLVSVAQALVQAPDILLLDEPTAALDLHRQMALFATLRRLAAQRGTLIVVALHDLNHALRFADQAILLADGGMADSGPVEQVINPQMLRRIFHVEARLERCSLGRLQLIVEAAI